MPRAKPVDVCSILVLALDLRLTLQVHAFSLHSFAQDFDQIFANAGLQDCCWGPVPK